MYKFDNNLNLIRKADGAFISQISDNADFITYQKWVNLGNVADLAPNIDPKIAVQTSLVRFEQTTQMNRMMREFMLDAMQDAAQRRSENQLKLGVVISAAQILAANPRYANLVAINDQAIALRAQL